MKSSKRITACIISILLLIIGLTSCGNLLIKDITEPESAPVPQTHTITGTITGKISTTGALPSPIAKAASSSADGRSAFPSGGFGTENYDFIIKASATGRPDITGSITDNEFSLTGLEMDTSYTLTATVCVKGDSDKVVLSGTYGSTIKLTEGAPGTTLETPILLKPTKGNAKGNISLLVTRGSNSVSGVDAYLDGGTESGQHQFFSFNSNNTATISFSNVNATTLTLVFVKNLIVNGQTETMPVYQCKEIVNVFDNMTTDTWIKNGNEKHLTGSNPAQFKITDECLEYFARNSYYVDPKAEGSENTGTRYNPYTNLEYALVAATNAAGDEKRIYVKDGTTATISTPITLNRSLFINAYKNSAEDYYSFSAGDKPSFSVTTSGDYSFTIKNESILEIVGMNITSDSTSTIENGGFFNFESGSGSFIDCSFSDGKATGYGGAIYLEEGELSISGCTFTNNQASSGMAVYSEASLSITGSSFAGNTDNEGIEHNAIVFKGNLTLGNDLEFLNGDELELWTPETITAEDQLSHAQITLKDNFSLASGASKIPLLVEFPDNHADQAFFDSYLTAEQIDMFNLKAEGCYFNGEGRIIILPVKVIDGTTTDWYSTLDDAFTKMSSSNDVEIILKSDQDYYYSDELTINNRQVSIKSNNNQRAVITAQNQIHITGSGTLLMDYISMEGDLSVVPENGGLIYIDNSGESNPMAKINNCSFTNGSASYGGAIYNSNTLIMSYCEFSDCIGSLGGGAIYDTGTTTLECCDFSSNKTDENGGAIYAADTLTLDTCTFTGHSCGKQGASVYCSGSLEIKGETDFGNDEVYIANTDENTYFITLSDTSSKSGTITFAVPSVSQFFTGNGKASCTQFTCGIPGCEFDKSGKIKAYLPILYGASSSVTMNVSVPANVSVATINKYLESNTGGVQLYLDLSSVNPGDIKDIKTDLPNVVSLTLPGGVQFVHNKFGSDYGGKPQSLKEVTILGDLPEDSDLSNGWMFQNCQIEKAVFNEGITYINRGMFSKCATLTAITLPSTVKAIGYHAFANTSLEEITIPASVERIEWFVFWNNSSTTSQCKLNKVTFEDPDGWYLHGTQEGSYTKVDFSDPANNASLFKSSDYGMREKFEFVKAKSATVTELTCTSTGSDTPMMNAFKSVRYSQIAEVILPADKTVEDNWGPTISNNSIIFVHSSVPGTKATALLVADVNTFFWIGQEDVNEAYFNDLAFTMKSGLTQTRFAHIYSKVTATFTNCSFTNATYSNEKSGLISTNGTIVLENCTFNNKSRAIRMESGSKLILKGGNSFSANDTICIYSDYYSSSSISLEAESVVKTGTITFEADDYASLKDKQVFDGTYVSQAANFKCADLGYYFDAEGYLRANN